MRPLLLYAVLTLAGCVRKEPMNHPESPPTKSAELEPAMGFGYKCAWLAVRATDSATVMARVGIRDTQPTSWSDGVNAAYAGENDRRVFVSPVVDGWVLVAGTALFLRDEKRVPDTLAKLSATLDTAVRYFATYRVSEYHTWIAIDRGKLVRAYSIGDSSVLFDLGPVTREEQELKIDFAEKYRIDEETVLRVAGRWSINPMTLEKRMLPRGHIGTLAEW